MVNRVVIIRDRFVDGDASINRLLGYAKGFSEQGAEVHVVFANRGRLVGNEPQYEGVLFYYLCDSLSNRILKFKLLTLIIYTFKLYSFISKGDKVLLLGYPHPLAYQIVCKLKKAKVFCEITEHPFYQEKVGYKDLFITKLFNRMLKRIDGVFVISHSLRDYYLQKGVKSSAISIINMFVDIDRFAGITQDLGVEKYIAYCGTVSNYKDGVDILIKSFAIFHKKFSDYKLYIIGSVSEYTLERLNEYIFQNGLNSSVVFTGRILSDKMPKILSNASILALARPNNIQAQNGFPTKLGEYLCTGHPVVITRTGEIDKFLTDGINCIFSQPDSVTDFAEKLIWTATHSKEANHIGENGRRLVLTYFSYKIETEKALHIMNNRK